MAVLAFAGAGQFFHKTTISTPSNPPTTVGEESPRVILNPGQAVVVINLEELPASPSVTPVPERQEVPLEVVAPNPPASVVPTGVEVYGVHLTIYNCTGSNGATYCPGRNITASGKPLTDWQSAACDRSFMGRKFILVGDPRGIVWECQDTGNFVSPLFDLWFYNLQEGIAYTQTIPYPVTVRFVN